MTVIKNLALVPACLGLSLLLAACANAFSQSGQTSAAGGSLCLSFANASAKTIVASSAAFPTINAYKVSVQSTSANNNKYSSTVVTNGTCTITGMVADTYSVTVQAYSDSGGTIQIAQGSLSGLSLSSGATTSATVNLSFNQTAGGTGSLSLNVQWPSSATLPYLVAKLDSPTATAFFNQASSSADANSNYSLLLTNSSITSGPHKLYLYFTNAASSPTLTLGPFVESLNVWDGVTDSMWVNSSGTLSTVLDFTATELASSDTQLSGLSFSGATLSPSFSATTTSGYSLNNGGSSYSSFSFIATADSGAQDVSYSWNGSTGSWTSVSGNSLASPMLYLDPSKDNTLTITVMAPDRQSTQSYTFNPMISGGYYGSSSFASLFPNGATVVLAGDVTINGQWTSGVGNLTPYTGTFDGQNNKITFSAGMTTGLFDSVSGTIKNLKVVAQSTTSPASATKPFGILANMLEASGDISNCSSSGTITGNYGGDIGGLVGSNGYMTTINSTLTTVINGGIIENSSSSASISAGGTSVGGLVGEHCHGGTIRYCYATGSVNGSTQVGGLVGDSNGTILQSYAIGNVTSGSGAFGGFVGLVGLLSNSSISNCYARGTARTTTSEGSAGGFVGSIDPFGCTFSACYSTGTTSGSMAGGFVCCYSTAVAQGTYEYCYQSVIAAETLPPNSISDYQPNLNRGLPSGFDSSIWTYDSSGTINGGYPYLISIGATTTN